MKNTIKSKNGGYMDKKEIKEKAKDVIQEVLAVAYYRVADNPDYGTEEANEIIAEMDKICERLCKQIGRKYYSL